MRILGWVFLFCLPLLPLALWAEEEVKQTWTLQECIDYALAHNITIRQNRVSAESSRDQEATAQAALFPTLSGSVSQRIVNRPNSTNGTIISGDNITSSESKTSYNGNYGLDLNWTLYNGGKRMNQIRQQKLNTQVADLAVGECMNSIEESIIQLYAQILYALESVKMNESTLMVSQKQYERGEVLYQAGSIASSDLAQLEAQVSNDNYQLVMSQNSLADYKLQLKQLLELDGDFEMNIEVKELENESVLRPLPLKEDVYQTALTLRPEIQSGQLSIDLAELSVKEARAGYLPTLSLTAGIGTTHSNGNDFTFGEQMKRNWNNSIGFTLSIPIYDRRQTRGAINQAKYQRQTRTLDLLERQKTLYKTIENLWLEAHSAQQQYVAASQKLKSSETSFALVSEQFNVGMKNTVELLTEKNNLSSAQQETLQAKYMALLHAGLLRFYQGEKVNLF